MTCDVLRFSTLAIGGVAGLAGLAAAGCGFVPGLDPWFDTRMCFSLGVVLGSFLG